MIDGHFKMGEKLYFIKDYETSVSDTIKTGEIKKVEWIIDKYSCFVNDRIYIQRSDAYVRLPELRRKKLERILK